MTKRLDCFLWGIWFSIISGKFISGHNYYEVYDSEAVQILKCEYCGYESVGWKRK